jgi:hypothetical protein
MNVTTSDSESGCNKKDEKRRPAPEEDVLVL